MSDKNYDNDPIERFFREKANNYDISYNEEDWLKLEARLDKADQQLTNRRRWQMAAAAVTLLFAVLAFFTYQQQVKINQLSDQLNNERVTNPLDNLADLVPETATSDDSESDENIEEEGAAEASASNEELPSVSEEPAQISESQGEGENEYENIQQLTASEFKEDYLVHSVAKTSPGFDGRFSALTAIRPINSNDNRQVPSETDRQSQPQNQGLASKPDQSEAVNAQQSLPRFSVGVQMGPDISTVSNLSDFAKPGHKIGLSFEYKITQNLAISTGAQHSKVRYVGSGNEYELPEGYLPYGAAPGEMEGVCLLIDIPVSLKYDFVHFHGSRIFASAGVSSYIMLDEDYTFRYEENQSELTRRWHKQTGTRHWMSNGTLSVGYELDLGQNISIRAEPFLKVPLKEVGWGNVDLYSMGSFFSINYKW